MNIGMLIEERSDQLGFMCREIIGNDVDLLMPWLASDNVGQESDELSRGVAGGRLADYCASLGVERCIQGQGAVSIVLEPMPFCAPWRQRQDGVFTIQCLNRSLFIDTEDRSILRRIQVQADYIGRFGFKIGIVRRQIT